MRRPATDINTKQRRILEFIKDSLHNEYRCPTVREICTHVGLSSTSTVQSHLMLLKSLVILNEILIKTVLLLF